jgi:hypothetical protein
MDDLTETLPENYKTGHGKSNSICRILMRKQVFILISVRVRNTNACSYEIFTKPDCQQPVSFNFQYTLDLSDVIIFFISKEHREDASILFG